MKNFKRVLCALLAFLLMLGMFSCKKTEETQETDTDATNSEVEVSDIYFFDYVLIRSEKASSLLVSEIGSLYGLLISRTGNRNVYETDALKNGETPDASAKEILVGNTNRPETEQALAQISSNEFIVAVIGNKIVITGITENTTVMAIKYFMENFLGEGADGMIAKDFFYKGEADVVMLTKDGKLNCSLACHDGDYAAMTAMNKVSSTLRAIAGESVLKTDDKVEINPEAYQIVFGYSSYEATATVAAETAPEGYTIDFVGNQIVVFAWTGSGMMDAAAAFVNLISKSYFTDDSGMLSICLSKNKITSDKGAAEFYKDVPLDYNGNKVQRIYDAGDNAMMLYWSGVDANSFNAYGTKLESLGFSSYQSRENTAIKSTTYTKGDVMVHVYYLAKTSELRAVVQKGAELPVNSYTYTKVCEPALTQLECEMTPAYACGASYLIRLEDGTFIVIDGGYATERNASELYNLMLSQKPSSVDNIVITAWIISHPQQDHYDMYQHFAKSSYKELVTVKTLIGQDCSDYLLSTVNESERKMDYSAWAAFFPGCKYIKAHTGQQFKYPGVTIDMLYTHEDVVPEFMYEITNAIDTAFMVTVNENSKRDEYKFLFINDLGEDGANRLAEMWGSELKCNVVQLGSHGSGGSVSCYEFADADICFCADHRTSYEGGWSLGTDAAKWAIDNIPEWIKAFEGHYTFWFEEQIEFEGSVSVDEDGEYTRGY